MLQTFCSFILCRQLGAIGSFFPKRFQVEATSKESAKELLAQAAYADGQDILSWPKDSSIILASDELSNLEHRLSQFIKY